MGTPTLPNPHRRRRRRAFSALLSTAGVLSVLCAVTVAAPTLAGAATVPGLANSVEGFGTAAGIGGGPTGLAGTIVGVAATPDANGYWDVTSSGAVGAAGDAGLFGSMAGMPLKQPIVGIAATPDGKGYWLVAADGGIFAFGDAGFFGSTGALDLNKPIVGMAATPDGQGYWLVASDGGIFAYGDAPFFGSTGSMHLNKAVVGMAPTLNGQGYWLVASDGGIFAYGDAPFFGSTGNLTLAAPIVGLAPTADGNGYWMAAADGGVFAFGDAAYEGSDQGSGATPVVGIAARPGGYWLAYSTTAPLSSALGEEQALALLGYLPLSWSPSGFAWRWAVPSTLSSLWVPGQPNVVLTGAAMTFEAENGLSLSGVLDGAALALLSTLLSNLDAHLNAFGYTYVLVTEHAPETLTLYRNGVPVLQTPANTGGYGTPTALGTYPIYERLLNQVMTGVTPAGVHYADPVSFVSYFNGGDALHYMPRATYGDPQSLGCVELPFVAAAAIWPLTTYGTLVSVI